MNHKEALIPKELFSSSFIRKDRAFGSVQNLVDILPQALSIPSQLIHAGEPKQVIILAILHLINRITVILQNRHLHKRSGWTPIKASSL